ncbi:DgyrCDS10968 [Dimorphilus gyrociliatus]|uniref:DgyrCDS10968 n=1 Tax=Dimorphilus gyrociliatus TaxID=2664684 RepID=A0A7I8W1W5_9ANNE|nr:DgyrCDS10968 [Dimorphilus gyrociliatus]
MATERSLLHILCIHGYRQNGQTFRERTGAFRKLVKSHAKFVFITAPNVVPPLPSDTKNDQDQRGWWFSRQDDYFNAQDDSHCDKGYENSLQIIKETCKTEGPFDGILGFSQGASMVSLILSLQTLQKEPSFQFKFAILVAGFKSKSVQHASLYETKIDIPTLHVFGENDKVIESAMSEELLKDYSNAKTLKHSGGHYIPATTDQKSVYLEFLQSRIVA